MPPSSSPMRRSANTMALSSIRLLVVSRSSPRSYHRTLPSRTATTPQPPGPGLGVHEPSVKIPVCGPLSASAVSAASFLPSVCGNGAAAAAAVVAALVVAAALEAPGKALAATISRVAAAATGDSSVRLRASARTARSLSTSSGLRPSELNPIRVSCTRSSFTRMSRMSASSSRSAAAPDATSCTRRQSSEAPNGERLCSETSAVRRSITSLHASRSLCALDSHTIPARASDVNARARQLLEARASDAIGSAHCPYGGTSEARPTKVLRRLRVPTLASVLKCLM